MPVKPMKKVKPRQLDRLCSDTGMTKVQIAEALGVTRAAIYRWIRMGEMPEYTYQGLVDLASGKAKKITRGKLSEISDEDLIRELEKRKGMKVAFLPII